VVAAVIMMAFCVMRLGRYILRVPHAVVTGFSCGIGAMMLISQLDIILGIASPLTRASATALGQLLAVTGNIGNTQFVPLLLGGTVIIAAIFTARRSHRLPAPLIGVALAFLLARLLGLREKEIGAVPTGLPPFAAFNWSPRDVFTVLPSALGLAVVSAVNILITSRVVEHFRGRHERMKVSDADAELGAYGIANVCGGIFGAPLSVGIPARSLAVVRCGGTSRLANLMHAAILFGIMRLGAGAISRIPIAALAGVTAWMGICLLDWSAWRRLPRMARVDAWAFLVTAGGVLAVNAVLAVAIGCSIYGIHHGYLRWTARPAASLADLQVP